MELVVEGVSVEEECIARDVLGVVIRVLGGGGRIDLDDNFFRRGGNSLNAVMAVTSLRDLGHKIGNNIYNSNIKILLHHSIASLTVIYCTTKLLI